MVENRKNTDKVAIQSFTVPWARKWAKWASKRTSECSGGRERSEQSGASEKEIGASEQANGRASGPVLTSWFLAFPDHCELVCLSVRPFVIHKLKFNFRYDIIDIRGKSKKGFLDLGHIEKCGFLHGVQHVSNIPFQVFFGVVKFWPFLLYFMGNFGVKIFQVFGNGSKLVLPDRTGIWHVENQTFIHYPCMLFE